MSDGLRIICAKCGVDTYRLTKLDHQCGEAPKNTFIDCKLETTMTTTDRAREWHCESCSFPEEWCRGVSARDLAAVLEALKEARLFLVYHKERCLSPLDRSPYDVTPLIEKIDKVVGNER